MPITKDVKDLRKNIEAKLETNSQEMAKLFKTIPQSTKLLGIYILLSLNLCVSIACLILMVTR
jgi:hypothetical protein